MEPIVLAVERAVKGRLGTASTRHSPAIHPPSTHLFSLDASNAFNAIDHTVIAGGTRQYAPAPYRAAKWAYGEKSDLRVGDIILHPSQGVQQGEPLGSLLFSVGLGSKCLATHLGPDRRDLPYLDYIYILSTDDSAQEDA